MLILVREVPGRSVGRVRIVLRIPAQATALAVPAETGRGAVEDVEPAEVSGESDAGDEDAVVLPRLHAALLQVGLDVIHGRAVALGRGAVDDEPVQLAVEPCGAVAKIEEPSQFHALLGACHGGVIHMILGRRVAAIDDAERLEVLDVYRVVGRRACREHERQHGHDCDSHPPFLLPGATLAASYTFRRGAAPRRRCADCDEYNEFSGHIRETYPKLYSKTFVDRPAPASGVISVQSNRIESAPRTRFTKPALRVIMIEPRLHTTAAVDLNLI